MDFEKFLEAEEINTDLYTALYYAEELLQEQARLEMRSALEKMINSLYAHGVFTRAWAGRIGGGLSDLFDFILIFGGEYSVLGLPRAVFSERFLQFLKDIYVEYVPVDLSPLGQENICAIEEAEKKSIEIGKQMKKVGHAALFNTYMRAIIKFWRMFHLKNPSPENPASKESHYARTIVEAMATNAFFFITFSEGMVAFIRTDAADV